MTITRCHEQESRTLDDFYGELAQRGESATREIGRTMLDLIAHLRALPDRRRIYGLTSHYRLCLLSVDTSESSWFVIISALNKNDYRIEYLVPERAAPWPHAYMRGETRSEDAAVQMILTAIANSEGWPPSA